MNMPPAANIKAKKPEVSAMNGLPNTYKCVVPYCGKDFRKRIALLYHYYNEHSDKKFYSCRTCQKTYRKKKSLEIHVAKLHPDKPKQENKSILDKLLNLEKRMNKRFSEATVTSSKATATATSSQADHTQYATNHSASDLHVDFSSLEDIEKNSCLVLSSSEEEN